AADGEDDLLRLTREKVAAGGTTTREQAAAGGVPALDLLAVGGGRAGHEPSGILLDPAERGDVVVRTEQDAGFARGRLGRVGRGSLEGSGCGRDPSGRATSGAPPPRLARGRTGSATRSISRNTTPGPSVRSPPPCRRATRRITRRL